MAKNYIISYLASLILTAILTYFLIPILKRGRAKQTILKYVTEHKQKNGTVTMGGIAFLLSIVICFAIFIRGGKIATVSLIIFAIYSIIGFFDDYIKIRFNKNEGLTPTQKIILQLLVSFIAAGYSVHSGLTNVYIPFTDKLINLNYWFIPFAIFVFLATTNCVNLTDGLDGLAGSVSSIVLLFGAMLIVLQTHNLGGYYVVKKEYLNLSHLAIISSGALIGYLIFNVNKASLFMGDTGSLGLGGLIASVYLFSGNALYIVICGIMFVLTGLSVIIQVLHYKRTKKRVFLMSPLHHHFQIKGYSETKIALSYSVITLIMGLISLLTFI